MSAVVKQDAKPVAVPMTADTSAMIGMIERVAANKDVDVGKLEQLLNLQERILEKQARSAFDAAMADMQAELPVILERGEIAVGGVVRSKYAKFEDINEQVKPILKAHGFSISFRPNTTNGKVTVVGILSHRLGHREQAEIELPVDTSGSKNPVQAVGSSVQYGKRYVLEALLNLTSRGQDDDGRKGGGDAAPDPEGKKKLEACGSLKALEEAWASLTKEQRKTLANVKDDVKAMIQDAAKRGV